MPVPELMVGIIAGVRGCEQAKGACSVYRLAAAVGAELGIQLAHVSTDGVQRAILYVEYFRDLRDMIAGGRPLTTEATTEAMSRYATEPARDFA